MVLAIHSVFAQPTTLPVNNQENQATTTWSCMHDQYSGILQKNYERVQARFAHRNMNRSVDNGNYEVHIYVDTSYERRRVGTYDDNQAVIDYFNTVSQNMETEFNIASSDWDVNVEMNYSFFDGATPFSYGNNIAETLNNFFNWVANNDFPGDDDVYVFYTGKYSNIGVSYLGALCFPGGATCGFIQSQTINEDISAHEWIGHNCDAGHYDATGNIMKSVNAQRPWNSVSIESMEDYLDISDCVENFQSILSSTTFELKLDRLNDAVKIQIESNVNEAQVELFKLNNNNQWTSIAAFDRNLHQIVGMEYLDQNLVNGANTYQAVATRKDGSKLQTSAQTVYVQAQSPIKITSQEIQNQNFETIEIYNSAGQLLIKSSEKTIPLTQFSGQTALIYNLQGFLAKTFIP